jgi:hypothetical protein
MVSIIASRRKLIARPDETLRSINLLGNETDLLHVLCLLVARLLDGRSPEIAQLG